MRVNQGTRVGSFQWTVLIRAALEDPKWTSIAELRAALQAGKKCTAPDKVIDSLVERGMVRQMVGQPDLVSRGVVLVCLTDAGWAAQLDARGRNDPVLRTNIRKLYAEQTDMVEVG